MVNNEDISLLRDYADRQSEAAFETVVARNAALVYSAALRQAGDPHLADEITQTVFILLARKAKSLSPKTILSGWLYRATHYTAAAALKAEFRRRQREQAQFLAMNQESTADPDWEQLAPLLDVAMSKLREPDRDAIVLRYFQNKSLRDVGAALGVDASAAQKRVERALEKLRLICERHGITSTADALAGTIAAHSVALLPLTPVKTLSTVALAKGAVGSTTTLTLIKGALKIMAWTKAKTAIVVGTVALFVAPPVAMITVKEYQQHRTPPWQEAFNSNWISSSMLDKMPSNLCMIVSSKAEHFKGSVGSMLGMAGVGFDVKDCICDIYGYSGGRTIFSDPLHLPTNRFDMISTFREGWSVNRLALQKKAEKKFGIVGKEETRPMDVMALRVKTPNAAGLKINTNKNAGSSMSSNSKKYQYRDYSMDEIASSFDYNTDFPVVDETGLTNHYDIDLALTGKDLQTRNWKKINTALDKIGLELVPTNMPIEVLVVTKR